MRRDQERNWYFFAIHHSNFITPQNSPKVRKGLLRIHPAVLRAPRVLQN